MTTPALLGADAGASLVPERRAESAPLHIPSLDGIRAFSFLIVFVAHGGLEHVVPGYFGLTLFFFLSGYLITTLLRLEFERTQTVSLSQFYLRRVLRIFPAFYLVLLGAALLTATGVFEGTLTAKALAYQLGHLTNYYIVDNGWWHGMPPGTWVYWSLAVEEHFYLVFPLLYLILQRRLPSLNKQALVLLALCGLVLAWRCVLVFVFDAHKERIYVASDTRVDSILAGCILAVWKNPALGDRSLSDRSLLWLWLPLGAIAVLTSLLVRGFAFEQTLRYTLQSFGLVPFFIAAVRFHDRGVFRILNLQPIRYLGALSYSMYLMHTTALWAGVQWSTWPIALQTLTVFVVLVVLASLIHRYVEKPCAALRRRFSRVAVAAPART